jgi:AcrR family transcriptional regulator
MDEIANLSGVSKQTVYLHFENKETLFVAIVTSMTDIAGDNVLSRVPEIDIQGGLAEGLRAYAITQLDVVMIPRLMQLRRLVIGEVLRFPELAKVLYERGPLRSIKGLATSFERLSKKGLLSIKDPMLAASHFNWLVMSESINRAMLLGDSAIPKRKELERYATEGVRVFLAAYGKNTI